MMLADICGSAEVFRRLSCEMRDALMRNINSIWQNRFVRGVRRQLTEYAQLDGFATASVATFFAPTRSFVMCNIGNPPPLVYRSRDRQWTVLHGQTAGECTGDDAPDGVIGAAEYRHIRSKLEYGDLFVLYGNGFAQSVFPEGSYVGHAKLLSALQETPHCDQRSRLDHLIQLIQGDDQLAPEEDSTIMVCEVTPRSVRLRDNFLAPLRLLRRPSDATQLT
jgi:serine phosphatase RsbU (regulator of sigma subunit)